MNRLRSRMRRFTAGMLVLTMVPISGLLFVTSVAADGNPRATGGGTIAELGAKSTVAFHAIDHQDGTVEGKLLYDSRGLDLTVQMDIDCLNISGNNAVMSGTITSQQTDDPSIPDLVGRRGIFQVEDNGEGAGDPPDLVSDLFITRRLERNCTNFLPPAGVHLPIDGNIQVQP